MADKRGGLLTTKFPSRGAFKPVERMPDWMRTGERWREQGITSDPDQRRQVLDWDAAQAGVQRQGRLYRGETLSDRVAALQEGLLGAAGQVPGVPWVAEKLGSALGSEAGRNVTQFLDSIPPGVDMGVGKGMLAGAGLVAKVSGKAKAAGKAVRAAGVGKRAASNVKTGAITNIRAMDPEAALSVVRSGGHLKQDASGQYVGAPRGINSPAKLSALRQRIRRDFLKASDEVGVQGGNWYDRARAGQRLISGPDPQRQYEGVRTNALFSAQATPPTNLNFASKAQYDYAGGKREGNVVRTGQQYKTYVQGRDTGKIKLGNKTGAYSDKFDPTFIDYDYDKATGQLEVREGGSKRSKEMGGPTNDIWHGRFMGFGENHSRGFTPQEHAFLDGESLLLADWANQNKLAGRTDWDLKSTQALPWVWKKGQSLAAKRRNMSLKQGYAEAAKEYTDALPAHTAFLTEEAIPGAGTGHLPGLLTASEVDKQSYTDAVRGIWSNPHGDGRTRDAVMDNLRIFARPQQESRGLFVTEHGVESNPQFVTPVVTPHAQVQMLDADWNPMTRVDKTMYAPGNIVPVTDKGIHPTAKEVLDSRNHYATFTRAQNAGAYSRYFPDAKTSSANAIAIQMNRAATENEMRNLRELGIQHGLPNVIDYAEGIMMTDFDTPRIAKFKAKVHGDKNQPGLISRIGSVLPDAKDASTVLRDGGYADYEKAFAAQNEGQGIATEKFLGAMREQPAMYAHFNTTGDYAPRLTAHADLDDRRALAGMGPIRSDIQTARRIMAGNSQGQLDALDAALQRNKAIRLDAAVKALSKTQTDSMLKKAGVWLPALGLLGVGLQNE